MTITTNIDEARKALVVALNSRERAKAVTNPEDNPFAKHDLSMLLNQGMRKGADNFPAKNMAEHGEAGCDMEVERNRVLKESKADKSAKRMAVARARAARKVEFDTIVASKALPPKARIDAAWMVVFHLVPIITRIANDKRKWAARLLGDVTDDVAQDTLNDVMLLLAKSDKDLDLLRQAAEELGSKERATGRLPGEQLSDDERKERKALGKARKWLMQVANNRVHSVLIDTYFRSHNIKAVNIDIIASVMASISGVGTDPITANFKADRAPAFMGTRFQRPGGIDPQVLSVAIAAAITEKRLDALTEILLLEENRRSDGRLKWGEIAEQVFLASPDGIGQHRWELVQGATAHLARPTKAQGQAARIFVQNQYTWLPDLIVGVAEAMDPHQIGWGLKSEKEVFTSKVEPVRQIATLRVNRGAGVVPSPNPAFDGSVREDIHWPETVGQPVGPECIEEIEVAWHVREARVQRATRLQAVVASDFELFYLGDERKRRPLVPALKYSSAEEAVEVIMEALSTLMTGEEFVRSVVE